MIIVEDAFIDSSTYAMGATTTKVFSSSHVGTYCLDTFF